MLGKASKYAHLFSNSNAQKTSSMLKSRNDTGYWDGEIVCTEDYKRIRVHQMLSPISLYTRTTFRALCLPKT